MPTPLFIVDAFAAAPFAGNPAAVVLLDGPRPDSWLAAVGAELSLSETAFVQPRPDEAWGLRWFTPTVEVDLCGHATLASAHVLWQTGRVPIGARIRFETRSGALAATLRPDGLITTALSDDPRAAVVSRYFCPAAGIPEDPVTGSAHCALAPYWAGRVGSPFRALQVSARGGLLDVELRDERVAVAGRAVTVVAGELLA